MNKKGARLFILALLAGISLLLIIEKNLAPGLFSSSTSYQNFELLYRVIYFIQNDYIEEANPAQTMKGAYRGLVNSLDVISSYLDEESMLKYSQRMDADLKGTGLVLYKRYGSFPQVVGIIENSPAHKHGIQLGDFISAIDDGPPQAMSLLETRIYLKDKDEKPVKLRILRGQKTLEINLERAQLFTEPASLTSSEGTSGILKIHQLYPSSVKSVRDKIISRLRSAKKPLILDLRNCYEGDIQGAQELINVFLKTPRIGYFEKKAEPKEYLGCPDNAELKTLPLVIWNNQATMGPSEIVAGVLQEFKRAKIIGLQTLGLAAKQTFFLLEDGTGLLLTSGIFHLNSGKSLWQKGVTPDVKIKVDEQSTSAYLKKTLS